MQDGLSFSGASPTFARLAALFARRVVHGEDRADMRALLTPDGIAALLGDETTAAKTYRTTSGGYGELRAARVDEDTVLLGIAERSQEIEDLHERIYTDSLSGSRSRRYYDERLAQRRCQALAMVDIDYFKEVNDEQGHLCGDAAIAAVAEAISSRVRGTDDVVRYGGDEFLVAFPRISEEVLGRRLEEIRQAAEAIRLEDWPQVRLSLSVGAACGAGLASDMLAIADEALYRSKERKNAVTILPYPPEG